MQPRVVTLPAKALEVAVSQIGQQEAPQHNNTGVMVDKYLASVGLNPGYPWCMSFVYYCFNTAASAIGVKNPVVKTGGVLNCWHLTPAVRKILNVPTLNPAVLKAGDQFILKEGDKGNGHTGIIESVEGSVIHTIEGNSNNDGSREGIMVVRHKRSLTDHDLIGFIQY